MAEQPRAEPRRQPRAEPRRASSSALGPGLGAMPRRDVGAAGLAGVLSVVLLSIMSKGTFDFYAWEALVGALVVFAAGYLPAQYKSVAMALAAAAATLVAFLVGWIFFDIKSIDNVTLSMAVSAFVTALVGYALPAVHPDAVVVAPASPASPAAPAAPAAPAGPPPPPADPTNVQI